MIASLLAQALATARTTFWFADGVSQLLITDGFTGYRVQCLPDLLLRKQCRECPAVTSAAYRVD